MFEFSAPRSSHAAARRRRSVMPDRATALDQATGPLALSDRLGTVLTEQFSRLALRPWFRFPIFAFPLSAFPRDAVTQ